MRNLILFFIFILFVGSVLSDEIEEFQKAKNAYEAGNYELSVKRFRRLLYSEPPRISNPALILEAHKYLAVSYLYIKDKEGAQREFKKLLILNPKYELDSTLFATEVLDFFTEIKTKIALALKRTKKTKKKKSSQGSKPKVQIIFIRQKIEKNYLWIAAIPFGIGQFQNRDIAKGYIFLSTEIAFLGASMVTFFWYNSVLKEAKKLAFKLSQERKGEDVIQLEELQKQARWLKYTNYSCLAGFLFVAAIGIIDAFINFEHQRILKTFTANTSIGFTMNRFKIRF